MRFLSTASKQTPISRPPSQIFDEDATKQLRSPPMLTNEASFGDDIERPLTPHFGSVMMTSSFCSDLFYLDAFDEMRRVDRDCFGAMDVRAKDGQPPSPPPSPPSLPGQAWRSAPDMSMLSNSCDVIGMQAEKYA